MKTLKLNNLSSYKLYWIELRPIKGIATLADRKRLGVRWNRSLNNNMYSHFVNRESAERCLESLKSVKLGKAYEARLFTDKQFGMAEAANEYAIPFTKMQNANMVVIGC